MKKVRLIVCVTNQVPARAAVAPRSYKPAKREISFQTPGASTAHGNEFLGPFFIIFNKDEGRLAASNTYGISKHQQLRGRKEKKMMENVSGVAGVRTGIGQSPKTSASNNIGPPTHPYYSGGNCWRLRDLSKTFQTTPKCASPNQPTAIATKRKRKEIHFSEIQHISVWILDKGAGSASYINPGGSQETKRISSLAMICSSAATNDPASAAAAVESTQLCKHSSGYPAAEQLGIAPPTSTRNCGMSYGSSNGNSNGSLIQHHHHHHDYGYHHHHHHLVAGSLRSPTVSSAPDSSFVGQQDHHPHQQHLDSCSIHSSAVAAVAAAAAAAAALTTYHHHQHQHPHSNLHPASTTTDSASAHQPQHNQLIAPMTQQSIPPKSKPTPAR